MRLKFCFWTFHSQKYVREELCIQKVKKKKNTFKFVYIHFQTSGHPHRTQVTPRSYNQDQQPILMRMFPFKNTFFGPLLK